MTTGRCRRLLSVGHAYVVGVNRRLAHELSREGRARWEVTAVAPAYFHGGNDLRPVEFEPWREGDEPCRVEVLPAALTRHVHLFHYGRRLRELLRDRWDLVHGWEEPYIVVGGQLARWTQPQTRLVYQTAQNLSKRYPPPFNWIERYAMRRAAGWSCCGQTVADALAGREPYRRRPMKVIPLGVDVERFSPSARARNEVFRELGWDACGPPVVGYVGRFTEAKGLRVLLAALDAMGTKWRALFVGAGEEERRLREWGQRQERNRVRICTSVRHAEVPRYLNAMDVLAAPSLTTPRWREQFGRMLVEAFACGVPVVGSTSGEIPFVVGDAGIVVGEGDVAAWAGDLASLVESPSRRRELSARGLARARDLFAWPVVARQYLGFFDEIVESGAPSGAP